MTHGVFGALALVAAFMSGFALVSGDGDWSLFFLLGTIGLYWASLCVSEEAPPE